MFTTNLNFLNLNLKKNHKSSKKTKKTNSENYFKKKPSFQLCALEVKHNEEQKSVIIIIIGIITTAITIFTITITITLVIYLHHPQTTRASRSGIEIALLKILGVPLEWGTRGTLGMAMLVMVGVPLLHPVHDEHR